MTFLPILRRELALSARRTATYRQRVIFAGLASATVVILLLSLRLTRFTGATIFQIVSWGGFILCALEGLRATADSISLERREGTLGLLLLTDLSGRDIVIGKVAAACLQSVTTVTAMLPLFAIPLLTGGVTIGECWRIMFVFIATVVFTLTAGTLVSTLFVNTLTSFLAAIVLILALTALPFTLLTVFGRASSPAWLSLAGPLAMFLTMPDVSFTSQPWLFWLATAVSGLFSIGMFVSSGFLLERFPGLELSQSDSWWRRWLRPRPGFATPWGAEAAHDNPSVWLAERTLPGQRVLWVVVITGALICFAAGLFVNRAAIVIMVCEVFFAYVLKLWLAAIAPQSLNNSRRLGTLELLLCTPLSPSNMVKGQVDALYGYFVGPALALAGGFPICGIAGMAIGRNTAALSMDSSPLVLGIFWFVSFVLDLHALAYLGQWFGLTHARVDRAIAKTVFGVLILPWITLVIPIVGCLGMIGWPIFWINWASRRLNARFREEVATLFSADEERYGWLPWSRRKN